MKALLLKYLQFCEESLLDELVAHFDETKPTKREVLEHLRQKFSVHASNSTRGQRNFWIMRGYSVREATERIKAYSSCYSRSITARVNRGEGRDEAENKITSMKSKLKCWYDNLDEFTRNEINSKKSLSLENLGKDRYDEICRIRQAAWNLDELRKTHGDSAEKYLQEKRKKVSKISSKEFLIEKYGPQEGERRWLKSILLKQRAHSLDGYVERYGPTEGERKFKERQMKWLKSIKSLPDYEDICKRRGLTYLDAVAKWGKEEADRIISSRTVAIGRASVQSLLVFSPLIDYLIKHRIADLSDLYLGIEGKHEYFIRTQSNFFLYDFCDIKNKIIIEFNGCAFHAKQSSPDSWVSPFGKSKELSLKHDDLKRTAAENLGFKLLTLWSDNTPEYNLKLAIDFYDSTQNNIR
jgi:hypothetical protein